MSVGSGSDQYAAYIVFPYGILYKILSEQFFH